MQITNLRNLPAPIVAAVTNDPYDRGQSDISVTGLIAPARQRHLTLEHDDEITEDAAERIYSLLGQAVHTILERADTEGGAITEKRLMIERHGWRISGAFDRLAVLPDATMQDYKVTSTWAVKDGVKDEWAQQLNMYRLIAAAHGIEVRNLQIVAILRDWQKSKAVNTPDTYPRRS